MNTTTSTPEMQKIQELEAQIAANEAKNQQIYKLFLNLNKKYTESEDKVKKLEIAAAKIEQSKKDAIFAAAPLKVGTKPTLPTTPLIMAATSVAKTVPVASTSPIAPLPIAGPPAISPVPLPTLATVPTPVSVPTPPKPVSVLVKVPPKPATPPPVPTTPPPTVHKPSASILVVSSLVPAPTPLVKTLKSLPPIPKLAARPIPVVPSVTPAAKSTPIPSTLSVAPATSPIPIPAPMPVDVPTPVQVPTATPQVERQIDPFFISEKILQTKRAELRKRPIHAKAETYLDPHLAGIIGGVNLNPIPSNPTSLITVPAPIVATTPAPKPTISSPFNSTIDPAVMTSVIDAVLPTGTTIQKLKININTLNINNIVNATLPTPTPTPAPTPNPYTRPPPGTQLFVKPYKAPTPAPSTAIVAPTPSIPPAYQVLVAIDSELQKILTCPIDELYVRTRSLTENRIPALTAMNQILVSDTLANRMALSPYLM